MGDPAPFEKSYRPRDEKSPLVDWRPRHHLFQAIVTIGFIVVGAVINPSEIGLIGHGTWGGSFFGRHRGSIGWVVRQWLDHACRAIIGEIESVYGLAA